MLRRFVDVLRYQAIWFTLDWWKYLLGMDVYVPKGRKPHIDVTWTKFWCRARGHPYGVAFFNPGGLEPDMHCNNCDDDLG